MMSRLTITRTGKPGRIVSTAGYAGLEDEVDNLLSTLLGVGSELGAGSDSGTGNNGGVIQALRLGVSDSLNQTGQKIVQRNLNVQPTSVVTF